jgi:hypothetical protein
MTQIQLARLENDKDVAKRGNVSLVKKLEVKLCFLTDRIAERMTA